MLESGPDHEKTFEVAALINEREVARGAGKTKKEAEQRAAESALRTFGESPERYPHIARTWPTNYVDSVARAL